MVKEYPIPGNPEIERLLLGCLLSSARTVESLGDILIPDHFLDLGCHAIYEAIQTIHQQGKQCSVTNVSAELVRKNAYDLLGIEHLHGIDGKGGPRGITELLEQLVDEVSPFINAEELADLLIRAHRNRQRLHWCGEYAKACYQQEEEEIQRLYDRLQQIDLGADSKPATPLGEALDSYMEALAVRRERFKNGIRPGVSTGFRALNSIFGGLMPSALYIFAAKTGVGKTAIALNMALNIVEQAHHALFYSLEMDEGEIVQRILSKETLIDQAFLRDGNVNDEDFAMLRERQKALHALPFDLDDRTYTLSDMLTKSKRIHARKPLDLIVVDYLQLIDVAPQERGKYNEQRYQEVGRISKELKRLARDLKVPVLALAQLSREADRAELPQLSHLYESSKLAQDSDAVAFIHIDPSEEDKRNKCEPYRVNVIVRKHRNGRLGQVDLMFQPRVTGFYDLPQQEFGNNG